MFPHTSLLDVPLPETFDLVAGFIRSVGPRKTIETINVIYPIAFPAFSYSANPVHVAPVQAFTEANVMPCNINRKCFSVYRSSVQSVCPPEGVHCEVVQSH